MARPLRIEFEDAIYHVTARGNERRAIFRAEADRREIVGLLERACERFEVSLLVFVLMGNHFHLVVQTHRGNLSRWMHWLLVSYTTWFNRRYDRSGHLFQGRYKSFLVEEGEYLLGLCRYLHLNPVRGKVLGQGSPVERRKRLRGYGWSSYRGYAGLGAPFSFVREEMVLGEMGGPRRGRALRYRRFVEEGLLREIASPLEAVQWQAVLGSESYARRIQDRMSDVRAGRGEMTALRRGTPVVSPEAVLKVVAKHYGIPVRRLTEKGGHGLEARNVALWIIWEKCGLSQRELGQLCGGMNYAAVAQRLRRLKPGSRETAMKLIDEMSNV